MDDDQLRLVALFVFVAVAAVAVVGGLLSPLAGLWQDGERRVRLRQWAFWVRGEASVDGGHQRFAGFVCFGRTLLWRRDYGEAHLLGLGFALPQVPALQGRVTGVFRLRLMQAGGQLVGAFYGRHFAIHNERLRAGRFVAATPRRLARVSG